MVHGLPRHSESNGGVEQVNRTVQAKLSHWMQNNKSRRWTIGCCIIQWQYNTQVHSTVGNTPYHLLYGQNPRVGITDLPITRELMEMLATEAELNNVVGYPGMVQVEDDHRVLPVRQGDESDEEETFSYMDELVMVSEDNADMFGPEAVNDDTIDGMENAFIC
jgi:hypothetical protein